MGIRVVVEGKKVRNAFSNSESKRGALVSSSRETEVKAFFNLQ
jgi:hypothetical protein